MPVCTSSNANNILFSEHKFLSFLKKPSGAVFIPPSPWIGSTNMAAVFLLMNFEIFSMSPKGTLINPDVFTPNPCLWFSLSPAANVPNVLP